MGVRYQSHDYTSALRCIGFDTWQAPTTCRWLTAPHSDCSRGSTRLSKSRSAVGNLITLQN